MVLAFILMTAADDYINDGMHTVPMPPHAGYVIITHLYHNVMDLLIIRDRPYGRKVNFFSSPPTRMALLPISNIM